MSISDNNLLKNKKETPMNLNHILTLLMAARGTMRPEFLPDEADEKSRFNPFVKKEYASFYNSLNFLIKNNYITPDAETITDKGIVFIEVVLKNCTKVHGAIADFAHTKDMLEANSNLASMFTKQPSPAVHEDEDDDELTP